MFHLSNFFSTDRVIRDTECSSLGGGRTMVEGTLAYADSIHYLRKLAENPRVAGMITTASLANHAPERLGIVTASDPRAEFYYLHEKLFQGGYYSQTISSRGVDCKIHPSAHLSDNVQLADRVVIGAGAVISGNVSIGPDVLIEPGARIGVEGILYLRDKGGNHRISHAGGVKIGAGATILANAVVVRSVHDSLLTEIGARSIIGIASCIGHEAFLETDCVISGNCVIARNAILEANVFIGTNAYVRENCRIGENARVMAGSIVVNDVPAGGTVSGNFALSHEARLKDFAIQRMKYAN